MINFKGIQRIFLQIPKSGGMKWNVFWNPVRFKFGNCYLFLLALCLLPWIGFSAGLRETQFWLLIFLLFSPVSSFIILQIHLSSIWVVACTNEMWVDWPLKTPKSPNLGPEVSGAWIAWFKFLGPKSSNSGDSGKTPKLAPPVEVTQVILTTHLCSTADLSANQQPM